MREGPAGVTGGALILCRVLEMLQERAPCMQCYVSYRACCVLRSAAALEA